MEERDGGGERERGGGGEKGYLKQRVESIKTEHPDETVIGDSIVTRFNRNKIFIGLFQGREREREEGSKITLDNVESARARVISLFRDHLEATGRCSSITYATCVTVANEARAHIHQRALW